MCKQHFTFVDGWGGAHWLATGEVNNTAHLVTMQCSAVKSWVLTVIWMLNTAADHPLKYWLWCIVFMWWSRITESRRKITVPPVSTVQYLNKCIACTHAVSLCTLCSMIGVPGSPMLHQPCGGPRPTRRVLQMWIWSLRASLIADVPAGTWGLSGPSASTRRTRYGKGRLVSKHTGNHLYTHTSQD